MNIQQSTDLIIFVTHVEAEDIFLKIWGQVDKNSATCVERMILPLVEQFARSPGCVGPQLAKLGINALCCARFQNEGYYRAKVINIRADGMVVLQFIDYGNIEVLPPKEVHLLENISGSESLQSFPPVAFEFTLMHVLPVNNVWDNKVIESIKKTLWYNEYKILIHSVVNNHRLIKLWYNNEDFSELLIKRHMAVRTTIQEMFRSKCVRQSQVPIYQQSKCLISNTCAMTPVHDGNEMHGFPRNVPLCCAAQKHMMQSSLQEALVFKSRVLDVPSKHDVYVSFVEDGPHKFSVQLQSTSQILSMLMREINSHPLEPLQEPPLPGSVCLGRYTQDKVLCRAVVMSVMENKCKLYYVDFGHTEILPYTDIFQLPPHFINPRVLSIRFTLSGVHELNVTDKMKEYFKQIVSGKLLVLHVRPPEGPPLVQYGDLYDNGKNIKDILREAFPTLTIVSSVHSSFAYQEPKELSKGTTEIVYISFVESCRKFFVQIENYISSLELIMNSLADFCTTAPTLSLAQLKIGLPCAALYDNQWYRAQILDVNADNIKVLYVDYGNEEIVTLMSLRLIRNDLVKKLPAQAIKCTLNDWELLPCTEEIQNQFELLTLEKRLHLRVVDVTLDGIVVDLYGPEQNKNIKSQMLNLIENEKKIIRKSLNYQNVENQHSTKMASKIDQRSYIKLPMNLVQQWKNEINIKAIREDTNKWHKKNQSELKWAQTHDNSTIQEKNKFKTWKNESNESNNWNAKWNDKHDYNDSFKTGKGTKGSKNKIWGSVKSHSSDKSWSDKDSDTSSKDSGKHGKSSVNRSSSKHESISGRTQSNKFNDRSNDGNYKNGKRETNSNSYHGNKIKERKGQGYRLTQNKSIVNFVFGEEEQKHNTMKSKTEFHIPCHDITIGTRKTCEVVFTNSLSDFFIQFNDYTALDSMMERIASIYETGGELIKKSEILCGTYCIAQYSDLKWYRAVIKSTEEKNATIQFIDYGNTETVELNKIKSIQKEFLELPIQAVNCKLFGIKNNLDAYKTRIFEHAVFRKILEAEFITEENGIYSVLLRVAIDPTNTFINQEFCEDIDLFKAKEEIMSNRITTFNITQFNKSDYISLDAKWTTIPYTPETRKDVIITWFINPNNFYCQILDNENEFRTMMNEIQKIYVGREPVSHTLQVGSPVIAIFSDDGALYRAEVIELNKLNGHLIQYIDFGNSAIVDPQNIYLVEKKFMHLPKQAYQCSLLNIAPLNGLDWSEVNTEAIDNCFNAENYECVFHNIKNNKYLISLITNGEDVANMLVEQNLALFNSKTQINADIEENNTSTPISYDIERVDINLLKNQTLRVKLSSIDLSASKFYIQIPSATKCENIINTYMTDKDPEVMQRLSIHEICLGIGCLVCSNGVWRRAVISSHSQSTGCYVKFIDTGACDEIFSNSILALPGELSVMQNQAIECTLLDKTNYSALESYLGEELIIYVDEIDNNRLIVKVFHKDGIEIDVVDEFFYDKTSPLCPMPILSSTHKVSVSYADHYDIWLKRNTNAEHTLEKHLIEALDQYYSNPESCYNQKLLNPKQDNLCAVKGRDDHWYRAKILEFTETDEVCINFIDYGYNEEVNEDTLRQLAPHFYVPYQLAINVSLPVQLKHSITIDEQSNILQNYLYNKDFTAVFYYVDRHWIVELLHDGEKISDKFRSLNLIEEDIERKISGMRREPQIHNMTIGCKYNVSVSHMDSPSQFWLQYADDATDLFNKQNELQDQVSTFLEIDGILEEGSLCVAVYTIDNLWYRAQVLDADEDITTVRFIDYGNTDVIDNKSGNIRQIPDSWKEMKKYAVKCRLDVIPVDSEDWNVTTCEKFENLVTSAKSLQALVIANSVPKRVDLLIDDKSVSETLVENYHAVKIHTEEELIDEIIDLELDPYSAFVSHINSPNEFWVQEEKSVGDLEIMTDRFIVAHMFPKVDEIKENLLCVAKYPEDECWYRARVVSHSDNAIRVIYIDYGNSATSNEIRAIPPDLADIPPLSRKCRLVMPEGITEWSEKACEEFITLAADGATIFLLDVMEEDETSLVKLTLDGKNVTDILANFCERYLPIIEERLPPLGEENSPNVFVSRINSPEEFWIQTETSETDLDTMFERLEAAPSFLPLSTFEIGTICAANYSEDGQWYRAQILSHSEEGTEVLYIDYGNTEITNETRMLPTDIINIPPLAKCCALQKPSSIIFWPSSACKLFKELATEETMFQFEILDDTSYPVYVKLSLNGKDVVDILMENISEDAAIEEENVHNGINDESNAQTEETKVNETKKEEQDEDMNRFKEYTENQNQEIKENTDNSYLDTNFVVELTVDEIVQNMKVDEQEEDEDTFNSHNHTIEMCDKNNSDETIGSFNELEMQTEIETFSDKNEIKNSKIDTGENKTHTEIKDVNDEVSPTTIKEVTEDFKQLETQAKTEIYSDKNEMQDAEIDTEKNKNEMEDIKIVTEKNKIHAEIKDVNEEILSITIKEVAENFEQLKIQVETESYNYENEMRDIEVDTEKNKIKGEIEDVNEKVSLNITEEVPLNTILDSPDIKNELKERDMDEMETYELSTDENKEYDKDCITQDSNEANADVTDPKSCSNINSVNEKVSSNLKSTEITSNESKVTDRKNDNPIITVTVYEESKRSNDVKNSLQLENTPTSE